MFGGCLLRRRGLRVHGFNTGRCACTSTIIGTTALRTTAPTWSALKQANLDDDLQTASFATGGGGEGGYGPTLQFFAAAIRALSEAYNALLPRPTPPLSLPSHPRAARASGHLLHGSSGSKARFFGHGEELTWGHSHPLPPSPRPSLVGYPGS